VTPTCIRDAGDIEKLATVQAAAVTKTVEENIVDDLSANMVSALAIVTTSMTADEIKENAPFLEDLTDAALSVEAEATVDDFDYESMTETKVLGGDVDKTLDGSAFTAGSSSVIVSVFVGLLAVFAVL